MTFSGHDDSTINIVLGLLLLLLLLLFINESTQRAQTATKTAVTLILTVTLLTKLLCASLAWSGFCSAVDINQLDRFLDRSRRHHPSVNYSTPQMNHYFETVLSDSYHVLHRLLPEIKTVPYNLRSRSHNITLTCKSTFYDDRNFISLMIFLTMFTNSTLCVCFIVILLVTMRCVIV